MLKILLPLSALFVSSLAFCQDYYCFTTSHYGQKSGQSSGYAAISDVVGPHTAKLTVDDMSVTGVVTATQEGLSVTMITADKTEITIPYIEQFKKWLINFHTSDDLLHRDNSGSIQCKTI